MITEYSMFKRNVRYTCETCGAQTKWWNVKQLKRCGETVGSWLVFWDQIIHPHKEANA